MLQAPETVRWKDVLYGSGSDNEAERRVKEQIAIGVSPLATSKYGKTLLHAAAIANNLPVARLAIASGVPIDQRAYPNGKRYQKRTLGWTALFYAMRHSMRHSYAMRHSTFRVARFLLENGATEVRSVLGETPIEVVLSARAEDSFWLLIEYGFSNMDRVDKVDSHRNIPPAIVSSLFAWTKMPVELIGFLERFLQDALGVTVSETECTELCSEFCSRCSSGLKSSDDKIREVWRERKERMSMWKPFRESFDYGYIRRCRICRTSLTKTRNPPPGNSYNVWTMILPSDTPAFSHIQDRNYEGKVPTLRDVTSF
jgi:ankyrin repeat protein